MNAITITFSQKLTKPKLVCFVKAKGQAVPLQAWTVPEVSWRMRLPDFKTIST